MIEPNIGRSFGLLVAEDDFSAVGNIPYRPVAMNGEETDMAALGDDLKMLASIYAAAAEKCDAISEERKRAR